MSQPDVDGSPTDPLSFLGFGFHIFGLSDLASSTSVAVVRAHGNSTKSTPLVPFTYTHDAYTTREQTEAALASEVGLDVSSGAFSAEFDATYDSSTGNATSSAYGLADLVVPASLTALTNYGDTWMAEGFADDPDVSGLPDKFDDSTRAHFFRVLRKYGTHFVSQIGFGGRLRAVSSMRASSQFSQQDAVANIRTEYDGFFVTGGASGSVSWSKLDQSWVSSRSFTLSALGGDPSLVPLGDHTLGATFDPTAWIASVKDAAVAASFRVTSLASAFSGPSEGAMGSAIETFLDATVQMVSDAQYSRSYATVGSARITPPIPSGTPPEPDSNDIAWIWVLLLDPTDLSVVLNEWFEDSDPKRVCERVDAAVDAAQKKGQNMIVAFGGYWLWTYASYVPPSLQALAEINGFDMSELEQYFEPAACNLSYVGSTSRGDRCAATLSGESGPASNAVNVRCEPIAIIDQGGQVL